MCKLCRWLNSVMQLYVLCFEYLPCFLSICIYSSLVDLRIQDYKSLCAAATICSTLVNIQTDRHTHRQHFVYMISSSSGAKNCTAMSETKEEDGLGMDS